ncbi:MauE/DoxX family redox-associated membrane protein [Gordonia sp. ABSL1-1]|uniref:MauE/DoxX family redox-associated membrane protein n=1 Tax=Gordonia sp. ABSL1-1 TaxID=3053923 RepID=UPI0025743287|nr:MauE/DoxX family redox-associated membrane protein [Gordonia sp. ABSL1-1]MDL9938900.1 MauE/DoxX family redox-associated membrane protein [Gordonia sp. ABSL1-1]
MQRVLPWISLLARLGLAGVLLVSGGLKALDPDQSEIAVKSYHLLSDSSAYWVSLLLPAGEIALGLLLLIGLAVRPVAIASGILFVVFIAGIASVWARGYTIDCGCFGGGGEDDSVTWRHYLNEILRDIGFFALAAWLAVFPRSWWALGPGSRASTAEIDTDIEENLDEEKERL